MESQELAQLLYHHEGGELTIFEFETQVMKKLLEGNHIVLSTLRLQYEVCSVSKRTFSESGFFTDYHISDSCLKLDDKNFQLGDLLIKMNDLKYDAGCVLHVKNGCIDYLEVYTFEEPWPTTLTILGIEYSNGAIRDLSQFEKI